MITLFVALCTLSQPATCHAESVGQFADADACRATVSTLQDWMKDKPGFEVASWWCQNEAGHRSAHGRFK